MTKLLTTFAAIRNVVRICLGMTWEDVLLINLRGSSANQVLEKGVQKRTLLLVFQDCVVITPSLVILGDTADPALGPPAIETWIVRSSDVG